LVNKVLEDHFKANYGRLMKRMRFRAGTDWDAEDVIQEAYCRALKYFKTYDGEHLDQWFSTILNNTFRDYKRNERGFSTISFEEEELDGVACSSVPDRVMFEIKQRIEGKPPEQREVLHRYFLESYTVREISEITGYALEAAFKLVKRFKTNELEGRYA
jgi:RNA polymerase sigma-70 factor (ECF subfamily)